MFNKAKEKTEDFVLELVLSIIETKKPKVTIESVIALSSKKGENKITAQLYDVLTLIEDGRSYLESFFYSNMLTDETYNLLKLADSKNALSKEIIHERIDDRTSIQKLNSAMTSSLIQPFMLIFVASIACIFIVTRIVPILISFYGDDPIPAILEPYIFANSHPLIGFILLVTAMFGIMGGVIMLIRNKTGKSEMEIYKIASIVKVLRNIGLNYDSIFMQLYETETSKKLSSLYFSIYTSLSSVTLIDAIDEMVQKMPIDVAVVLSDKINSNEDIKGWEYTKEQMKQVTFKKIDGFSKMLPFLSYVFIFLIIFLALIPIGLLSQKAIAMAG